MAKPLAADSSKWYRYSLPVDENFDKSPPEKGKKRRKRRKAPAVPSLKRVSGPAVRSSSRAGSRASSLAGSLAGSRDVSRSGSLAGSLAPSVAGSPLLLQPPRPPHSDVQRPDSAARGSLALPVQPAQSGLPPGQVLPKSSLGTEEVDQYGPATRFVPPVWPTGYQGPEAIMATGEMQPPPSEFGYMDETMGVAGGPWPLMAYQDGRKVVIGRAVAREQHITLPCLLCAVSLFAIAVAGIFVVFSMYVFTIPWWLSTEETTTSVFETLPGGGEARRGGESVQISVNAKRQTASRSTQPPTIWFQTADSSDPRYTDRYHRTACVFHANADGLEPVSAGRSARYGLSMFPFALCRVALFCCPSLAVNVEPGSEYPGTMTDEFSSRARRTGFVEPFMMLGDGSQSSQASFEQLLDDLEARSLPDTVGSWYKTRNYTGVVLRLPESVSASAWLRVPSLLGQLAQTLAASPYTDVRLGVALRQDSREADLRGLGARLGQVSVFLLPQTMTLPRYMGLTFSYFGESTLASLTQLYTAHFGPDHGQSVCYLLPADTYTFQILTPTNQTPIPRQRSIGPGIQGPVTGQQGRMAYFESCRIVADMSYATLDLQYGAVASRQNSWLSYTKPQMLGRFADALHDNASATCVGLWNPQWDDFASLCGHGAYPLARALFRLYADIHP